MKRKGTFLWREKDETITRDRARLAGLCRWTLWALQVPLYFFRRSYIRALCVGVRTATLSSHTVYHDVKVLYKY